MNTADACTILSDADRRRVIRILLDDRTSTIDDLAADLAGRAQNVAPDAVDPDSESFQRAKIALVHNHLPRLESHGVIEYDNRNGDVVLDDPADLETFLSEFDEQMSLPVEQ